MSAPFALSGPPAPPSSAALFFKRGLILSGLLASLGACSATTESSTGGDDITSVSQSGVRRQSIGNCWVYAVLGWVESVNMRATNKDPNLSETYLTYWHWFDQLLAGEIVGQQMETGGTFAEASLLIAKYGLMTEGNFVPEEWRADQSARQAKALNYIRTSLASGALKELSARNDRKLVRAELDKAFELRETAVKRLNAVFGEDVSTDLRTTKADLKAARIFPASSIYAAWPRPDGTLVRGTLADLLPEGGKSPYRRVVYPSAVGKTLAPAALKRQEDEFWRRVKKALHAQAPVVTVWFVDFNALTPNAHFSRKQVESKGIGRQGSHMTVASDYEAVLADGTRYAAGTPVTDPRALASLLRDDTRIEFLRVKNSWGTTSGSTAGAAVPGYHDLDMDYIRGPLKYCARKPDGTTDMSKCDQAKAGLYEVYLPSGF